MGHVPPSPTPMDDMTDTSPPAPLTPDQERAAIVAAITNTDEPLSSIAKRFGRSRARVAFLYAQLTKRGHAVPERRRGVRAKPRQPETVGARIAEVRESRGLSQSELAELMDPPAWPADISKAEGAVVVEDLPAGFVGRIAEALECDPCDIDTRLAHANSLNLVRSEGPGKPVGWEPLRVDDREKMDSIWTGDGPALSDISVLVGEAIERGMVVVLRGDLPVRVEDGGGEKGEGG